MSYDPGPLAILRAERGARLLGSERFNPHHDKSGKFASGEGGPGSGVDLIAAGRADQIAGAAYKAAGAYENDEGDVLAGRMLYDGAGVGPHGDEALHHIAAQQGFEGPARGITRKEMDKEIRQGGTEMFRGVRASADGAKTAAQIHEQMRSGEAFHGLGYSGNGTYMSSSRNEAGRYGSVGRYALHRDARVVDYRQLQTEQESYLRSVGRESITGQVFSDPGRYAAARGYDAIKWRRGEEVGKRPGEEDEFIVLNRTALLSEVA